LEGDALETASEAHCGIDSAMIVIDEVDVHGTAGWDVAESRVIDSIDRFLKL